MLALRLPQHAGQVDGLPVAVKVRELEVAGQRAHNAEVVGAEVRLGGADFLTPRLRHLEEEEEEEDGEEEEEEKEKEGEEDKEGEEEQEEDR